MLFVVSSSFLVSFARRVISRSPVAYRSHDLVVFCALRVAPTRHGMLAVYLLAILAITFWLCDAGTIRVYLVCAFIFNYATPTSFTIAMIIYLFLGLVVPRLHSDERKIGPNRDLAEADRTILGDNPFLTQVPKIITPQMRAKVNATTGVITNSRSQRLFTRQWNPANGQPKALLFICHGHGDHSGLEIAQMGYKFASEGYGVYSMDFAGFGLSDGLHGYIPNFERLIDDAMTYFESVKESVDPKHELKWLLKGHSMGGAVAIKLSLRLPNRWDGCVFVAPMCGVKESAAPPPWMVKTLQLIMPLIPTLPVTPTKLPPGISYADQQKVRWVCADPLHYFAKARLGSAGEMLAAMQDIEKRMKDIAVPFFILHGTGDKVTDPELSQRLYDRACSANKQIRMYDGLCHALMTGETDDNCLTVYSDVLKWCNKIADS